MIIFGIRHYGAVDQLGEGRHVATRFFHIMFVPVLPAAATSVLVVDSEWGSVRGIEVPFSIKSVFAAYLRAASFCYAAFAGFSAFGAVLFFLKTMRPSALVYLTGMGCSGLVAFILFLLSYGVLRPSTARREALERMLI